MAAGQVGIDPQRGFGAGDAFVYLQAFVMQDGQIVQAQGIVRGKLHRAPARRHRVVQAVQRAVDLAEITQVERDIDAVLDCLFNLGHGFIQPPQAKCHQAGQMQAVGLVRRDGEDVAEQTVGFLQIAGPLVSCRDREQFHQGNPHPYIAHTLQHGARRGHQARAGRGILQVAGWRRGHT